MEDIYQGQEHVTGIETILDRVPASVREDIGLNTKALVLGPVCEGKCFFCEVYGFPYLREEVDGEEVLSAVEVKRYIEEVLPDYELIESEYNPEEIFSRVKSSSPMIYFFSEPLEWQSGNYDLVDFVEWMYQDKGKAGLIALKGRITTVVPEGTEETLTRLVGRFDSYIADLNDEGSWLNGDYIDIRISINRQNEYRVLSLVKSWLDTGLIDEEGLSHSGKVRISLAERRLKDSLISNDEVKGLYESIGSCINNLLDNAQISTIGRENRDLWPRASALLEEFDVCGRLTRSLIPQKISDPFFEKTGILTNSLVNYKGIFVSPNGEVFNIVGGGPLTEDDSLGISRYPVKVEINGETYYRVVQGSPNFDEPNAIAVKVFDCNGSEVGQYNVITTPLIYAKVYDVYKAFAHGETYSFDVVMSLLRVIQKVSEGPKHPALTDMYPMVAERGSLLADINDLFSEVIFPISNYTNDQKKEILDTLT
jgi:hypothetical protein